MQQNGIPIHHIIYNIVFDGNPVPPVGCLCAEHVYADSRDNVWELAKSIVTGSSMLLFPLIILFGIILLPVILIVLLIIFLMRDRKCDKRQAYYTNPSEANSHINTSEPRNLQKEKENLVIHCSVALGLLVFCIAYDWRFGTLLAIIYLCVQGGKLYNVWRAQKKDDNNNYF